MRPHERWTPALDELHSTVGMGEFRASDLVPFLQPLVNPMEMARSAMKTRKRLKDKRHQDAVLVGMKDLAHQTISNRIQTGRIERVGYGIYRFTKPAKETHQ